MLSLQFLISLGNLEIKYNSEAEASLYFEHITNSIDLATKISIPDYVKSKEIKITNYGAKIRREEKESVEKARQINYEFKLAKSDQNSSQDLLYSLYQSRKEARREAKQIQNQQAAISKSKHYDDIMSSDLSANSREFSNLVKMSRVEGSINKTLKVIYEGKTYLGDEINTGLEKYFIKVLAKSREDGSFDDFQLVINELQLLLINDIIFHTNKSHIPFTPEEVERVLRKHMKNCKGMDINYHITEQYTNGGPILYKAIADFWNQSYLNSSKHSQNFLPMSFLIAW